MGLFGFFKRKEPPNLVNQKVSDVQSQPYLGDLDKTSEIYHLIETPVDERDNLWENRLLSNLPLASFKCGDPQVVVGSDGFPYFQLFLPEPMTSFQCFVIDRVKDDFLLEAGYGVVIMSSKGAEWVLSYGDILCYHLNNSFYFENKLFSKNTTDEIIQSEEQVMIGAPDEKILPTQARRQLKDFLVMNGLSCPKVLLMVRNSNGSIVQDLVFNATVKDFKTEEKYRTVMQMLAWYLPKSYSYVGMDESVFGRGFEPL